jgi:LysM repeat protein
MKHLYSLSRIYGVSVDELKATESTFSGSQIRVGQVLVIRQEAACCPVDNSRLEMRLDTHKIKYGDSLE